MRHWDRLLAAILAFVLGANGLVMLFASLAWYDAVPGVPLTGPFNPHFVRDVGAAYLTAAAGIAWYAARPRQAWPALVAAAVFLALHAAIHVYDAACGTTPLADVQRDLVGVYVLGLLPLLIALTRKPTEA